MEMNRQRFLVLERLFKGETPIIVASAEALLDKYPPEGNFRRLSADPADG